MTPLYIFDIDGTLANQKHRQHHLDNKDYDTYYSLVLHDTPIPAVVNLCRDLYFLSTDYGETTVNDVWFFSGRRDSCKDDTVLWLRSQVLWGEQLNPDHVVMRRTGDFRDDVEVKQEMLNNMLDVDRNRLVCVFDDRQRVVDMWRRNGITCLQVAPGDF